MPLFVNGQPLHELPKSTQALYGLYPALKDTAQYLIAQTPKVVSPVGSLFVLQREFAVVTPNDKNISIVGTDDATTCCTVILRHTGSGTVGLAHADGSGLPEGADTMVRRVQECSTLFEGHGHLELHLIGGFIDDQGYSNQLVLQLLDAFNNQSVAINLVTACVCQLNNIERAGINWPIIYGVAVNVKTGEIFSANFPESERGPELLLRHTRIYTGQPEMMDIYESQLEMVKIGPFNYKPRRGIDLWLSQPDDVILQHLSTSPLVEPPHFVSSVKQTLSYIQQHPFPAVTLFPQNRPHCFRPDNQGGWEQICYSDECA